MLIWLADWLTQFDSGFNVFSYLTLRAILSTLTALLIAILIGPKMIRYLQRMQIGQTVHLHQMSPIVLLKQKLKL